MRIETIRFDNINSLGGHFELHLNHPSLTDAGLFVITGPTGAGKTTLLDAITYAIYGQTARQGKVTATSNEIMTHGTRFCRAEAVVEKDGTRYLFSTEQKRRRTRSDNAAPYTTAERRVSRLLEDGTLIPLHSDVNGVRQLADSLMKYENFCRCMMLAQGEFARFLRADAKERSETLATITGTEIYQRIGDKVQARVAGLRASIDRVALLPVMDAETRAASEQRRDEQEARCKAGQQQLEELNGILSWKQALRKAEQGRLACEGALARAQEQVQEFAQERGPARIRAAEAAQQLKPLELARRHAAQAAAETQRQLADEERWLREHPGRELKTAAEQAGRALAEAQPGLEAQLHFLAEQVQPLETGIREAALLADGAAKAAATRRREAEEAERAAEKAAAQLQQAAEKAQQAEEALAKLPALKEAEQACEAARQRAELAYKIQDASGKLAELYREFSAGRLPCCPCCGSPVPHHHPKQDANALAQAQKEAREREARLKQLQRERTEAQTRQAATQAAHQAAQQATRKATEDAKARAALSKAANEADAEAQKQLEQARQKLVALWQGGPARQAEQDIRQRLTALQRAATQAQTELQSFLTAREAHAALARAAGERLPALTELAASRAQLFQSELGEQGFADENAYTRALLPMPELHRLRERANTLQQALAAAQGALTQAREQEEELRGKALSEESEESLRERKAQLALVQEEQNELLTQQLAQLRQDDDAQRANAAQEAQLADTRRELAQWQRLYEVLGNTRDGFKKYAQRITFNLLLEQANAKLRLLSDRYTLLQDTREELALRVLDRYQDEAAGRSCSNLSGGESFIVSLALALGLAQMTGETRIDTLFLDEGFGTLDEDALEQVLNCLQSLRAGGKLIGIISHVDALKERIAENIELLPRGATGLSTIAPHAAVASKPSGLAGDAQPAGHLPQVTRAEGEGTGGIVAPRR